MKLQILVPHFKENAEEIEPLLDSIAIQQSVDFKDVGVIIAFDGPKSKELPEEMWIEKYPFEIQYVHAPKGGVSATRNTALDAATADYVMFCDADDMFCHVCGLHIIFNEIKTGFDTLTSLFIEESRHPETKEPLYVNHEMDSTFVHGKVHRRGYLLEKELRFNDSLTVHEDSYFNILAQNLTDKGKYCPTPFYLWRWRDSSVCRHDPDYILKTYNNMLDSNDALVDEFERRGKHDLSKMYACMMIMDAYYTMNKREWLDKTNSNYRKSVERRFSKYLKKHQKLWDESTDEEKAAISNGVRTRSVMEGMPMEAMTLDSWLSHIKTVKSKSKKKK